MRTASRLAVLVLVVGVFAACGDDGDEPLDVGDTGDAPGDGTDDGGGDADRDSIEGEYIATEVTENGAPKQLVEGTTIRLRLEGGSLGVGAGCNGIGGDYSIRDGVLHVEALSMTEMGCDPPRHDQDEWIADLLSSEPEMDRSVEEGFVLRTETASITFVDHSVVEPDVALVGTAWEVTGFVSGPGPDATATDAPAGGAVVFEGSGYVTGNDGCNDFGYADDGSGGESFGVRYEVVGDRLDFTGTAVSTDIGCPDVPTEDFWAVLTGTVAWEIDGDALTLTAEDGRGVTFRADG